MTSLPTCWQNSHILENVPLYLIETILLQKYACINVMGKATQKLSDSLLTGKTDLFSVYNIEVMFLYSAYISFSYITCLT